eukprot:m.355572 g.355572  ORF g.355572 m.355572 type:complete len:449 (+) comp17285_c0_seq1:238-1584(+)
MADGSKQLWQSILQDVTTQTTTRHLPHKNILLLGDEGCGSSSLVCRLQGRQFRPDDHPFGTGLEYNYVDIKEDEDVIGRLGMYTLDGNEDHKDLIPFVLNKDTLGDVAVMIVVDYSRPWSMLSSLQKWVVVLQNHLEQFEGSDDYEELKTKNKDYFQRFQDPADGEESDALLDLDEDTLTINLGIPIIVVVNKADAMINLRKNSMYQTQHFDFIQMRIRTFCLAYGAAVIYSGREVPNNDILLHYMCHRVYGMKLLESPNIQKPEATFIPSAWDSKSKINVLQDGLKTLRASDDYAEVIKEPVQSTEETTEVMARDEQEFLKQLQQRLGSFASAILPGASRRDNLKIGRSSSSSRRETKTLTKPSTGSSSSLTSKTAKPKLSTATSASGGATTTTTTTISSSSSTSSTTKAASTSSTSTAGAAAGGDTDVLASFFTSLLKQTPGTDGK